MSWLEFSTELLSIFVWPLLIFIIFLSFREQIRAFLEANRVKRIKGGPFEAEFFESVSKAKEAIRHQNSSEALNSGQGAVPINEISQSVALLESDEYILAHRPEYAVLESWKELEGALQLAASVFSENRTRYRPIRKVVFDLVHREVISPSLGEALLELNDARNAIVHKKDFIITTEQAQEYIKLVEAALQALQNYSEGN